MSISLNTPARPLSADRRSFLAAGMATVVAASVAAPAIAVSPRAEWDAAMANYVSAKRGMDGASSESAARHFIDAEAAILDTRTPDMKALHWKLEQMRDICEHSMIEPREFEFLLADVARMMGGA